MINILSHRGYWKSKEEKNTVVAFNRSFEFGYGTETDIRDYAEELVISHDIPTGNEVTVEDFLKIYKGYDENYTLALNIKSDGLQNKLSILLEKYQIENYFLFDMSVPDAIISLNNGLNTYTRQSEYEQECSFYEKALGVWMDEFHSDWITNEIILNHINKDKLVCIVSPELHGRDPMKKWIQYRMLTSCEFDSNITICTDLPEKLKDFLNEKD